jgi:hypothetical protein
MEAAMAKALDVNDNKAQNQERQQRRQSGDEGNTPKLQGKAFQINENSVEEGDPVGSPAPPQQPSGGERNPPKLHGKAFQVNENSVEDGEPVRPSAPPRRG